jgi:transcriptional regulator with XRE-family HTH domain
MSKVQAPRGEDGARANDRALMSAKMSLVAAHEHGETAALALALRAHPTHADALTEFDLALMATSGPVADANEPDVMAIAETARARAFAKVFGVATQAAAIAQPVAQALSLKDLRQARGQKLSALAERLGLGVDVLSALESGRIRVASVPRRLRESLADILSATADQISAALTMDVAPALRRGQSGPAPRLGGQSPASQQLDFRDAVLLSKSMSEEQRVRWLGESAK